MEKKTKHISISDYVKKVNPMGFRKNRKNPEQPVTPQAIKHRINKGLILPEVLSVTKVASSRITLLEVDIDF